MKAAVPFTGGVDSTYAIWKILTTTQDDVTAVVLDAEAIDSQTYRDNDMRIFAYGKPAPMQRIAAVVDWFSANLRPITLLVLPIDVTRLISDGPNIPETYFTDWAVEQVNLGSLDRIIITHEKENDGNANRGPRGKEGPGSWLAQERFLLNATRGSVEFPLIESNYHHGVAIAEMPTDLLALTLSCGVGGGEATCSCFKCAKNRFFASEVQSGKTMEEIADLVQSYSVLPNGKWMTMKSWLRDVEPTYVQPVVFPEMEMPTWPSSVFK